jgi:CcmD family protein
MDSYEWIMYSGMAVWLGLGLYLCLLARKQSALSRRISRIAAMMEETMPEAKR